jgi:hypothetical protein
VRVEIAPGERFAHTIETMFGLARLGYPNVKGMPHLLQVALVGREFSDVIVFGRPPVGIGNRLLNEPCVSNETFVPPEVGTGDVPERQPETGVHRGVVGRVPPFDRREGPGDLDTVRGADVCEVGASDRRVVPDVGGERLAVDLDGEAFQQARKGRLNSRLTPSFDRPFR